LDTGVNPNVAEPCGLGCASAYLTGKQFYCPGTRGCFDRLGGYKSGASGDLQAKWYWAWEGPSLWQTYVSNWGQPKGKGQYGFGTPSQVNNQNAPIVLSSYFYRGGEYYPETKVQKDPNNLWGYGQWTSHHVCMSDDVLVANKPYLTCFSPAQYRYQAVQNYPAASSLDPSYLAHLGQWENLAMDDGSAVTYVLPAGLAPLFSWQDGGGGFGPDAVSPDALWGNGYETYINTPVAHTGTTYAYTWWSVQMPYYWTYLDHKAAYYPYP
jgi:hypothetical protein